MTPYGSTDKVLVLYQLDPGGTNSDGIYSRAVTRGGGAGASVEVGNLDNVGVLSSPVRISDTAFHYILSDNGVAPAEYVWNDVTWSGPTTFANASTQYPALNYDRTNDDLYVFAIDTAADDVICYRKPSGGGWDDGTIADGGEANLHTLPVTQMHEPPDGSARAASEIVWGYRVANGGNFDLYVSNALEAEAESTVVLHPTSDGVPIQFGTYPFDSDFFDVVNDQTGNSGTGSPEAYDGSNYIWGNIGQRAMLGLDNGIVPAGATITEISIHAQTNRAGGQANLSLSYQRKAGATTPDASPIDGTGTDLGNECCTEIIETWSSLNWTTDDLDNLEIGAVQNSGDGDSRISQLYVEVTYVATGLTDSDGDGLWDHQEDANTDADNDPATNPGPDTDGDTFPNYLDADDDDDGTPTASENADPNGDGDPRDALDTDRDGQPDYLDAPTGVANGTVGSEQKISSSDGGLGPVLDDSDFFGCGVGGAGDLDGDGVNDIVVGAECDGDGGTRRGAVYVLFLNPDGTVGGKQKISDLTGGFGAALVDSDYFGAAVAGIGDIDGDGVPDIAVGATGDDDGGAECGAVYVLFMNRDGTVKSEQKISASAGGLSGPLTSVDRFGGAVAGIGDLDGDGINDLAVGAYGDDDGGSDQGAVYVLFLAADGTVKSEQKISSSAGGLGAVLANSDFFGTSVGGLGDLDNDGLTDLVIGANGDDDGGTFRGAVYVLFLNGDGTVKAHQKISSTTGGLPAVLDDTDLFGTSVVGVGDVDADGLLDAAVGAYGDDDGGSARGAAYLLFLNGDGTVKSVQKFSATAGGFTGPLDDGDYFGIALGAMGDLDGGGTIDLAVGAERDDDGGTDRGAVYVLNLASDALHEISGTVFEDIAGDVLADGSIGDANNSGVEGVDVYLYLDDGDTGLDAGDTLIGGAPTQTDTSGTYSFTGLSDGDYFLVVDSKTVGSTQDPGAVQADIWAEQTYGPVGGYYDNGIGVGIRVTAGPCYGGIAGHLSDDFSQWDDREHRAILTVSGSDISNVDFGFSFNVVTNLAGGDARDDDVGANRTVQGSLRQFIQNANAINAANVMRFVPAESPGIGDGLGNLWWRLPVTELLPAITGDGTTIDGRAFDHTDGTTLLDPNAAEVGAGLAVGTEGSYTTPTLDPELEIWNDRAAAIVPTGLVFEANDGVLRHVSIWGFGDSAGTFDANVRFGTNFSVTPDFTGSLAEFNVIGTGPASFTEPSASDRSGQKNLTMRETDGAIVRDNLIGFASGVGVDFNSASNSGVVLRNEIRRNGIVDPISNPVGVWISGNVTGNLIADNASGIYSGPTLGISYHDNTITANGWGGTRPDGIRASGSSETIQRNVIADNAGAAVVVQSTTASIEVSRNSIYGNGTLNGQIGIDLLGSGDDPIGGPFITINDSLDIDSGGNDLLNFPVINVADIQGSDLIVSGWARPGSQIEFYLADPDPLGYGEGKTWLITRTEGSVDDTDASTGTYGPGAINGIVQGTDSTNVFSFTIPLASLAAPVGFYDEITALAYLGGNTSEFSANVVVSATTYALSGTVFEDADFAGTSSAYDGGTTDLALANVDVELYDATDSSFVATTITDGTGLYTFSGLADGDYFVRVRSATIGDADTPPAGGLNASVPATWPYPLAEMTWGNGAALYGGQSATANDSDTGDDAGLGDTHLPVTVSGADVTSVDFGFAYNLIVNVEDDGLADTTRSDQGSLRQFLKNANAIGAANGTTANSSVFAMQVPANQSAGAYSWWRISPVKVLPDIADGRTVIDGSTQTGHVANTSPAPFALNGTQVVEIEGSLTGAAPGLRFVAGSDSSMVRGLVIGGFSGVDSEGIVIDGAHGITLAGLYVGTDATGLVANANNYGTWVVNGASGLVIGGTGPGDRNLFAGNVQANIQLMDAPGAQILGNLVGVDAAVAATFDNFAEGIFTGGSPGATLGSSAAGNVIGGTWWGIYIEGSNAGTVVAGNIVGTDPSYSLDLGSTGTGHGIYVDSDSVTVGGPAAGDGNVIGFYHDGIGVGAAGVAILGNSIGVDPTGTDLIPNNADGVSLSSSANCTVGGPGPGEGNLISANGGSGVVIVGAGSTGNTVEGNTIGLNAAGDTSVGNGAHGVHIYAGAHDNTVGGSTPGAGNLIGGNTASGVLIAGSGTTANTVAGNYIGVDVTGLLDRGNGSHGIHIDSDTGGNTIGGVTAAERNVISGNGANGILLQASSTNIVWGNYIGVDKNGVPSLGNGGHGILIDGGDNNVIGGTAPGEGNLISGNLGSGVTVTG
jgi:hypothetical protein